MDPRVLTLRVATDGRETSGRSGRRWVGFGNVSRNRCGQSVQAELLIEDVAIPVVACLAVSRRHGSSKELRRHQIGPKQIQLSHHTLAGTAGTAAAAAAALPHRRSPSTWRNDASYD
jgi:hypothetical protein